MSITPQAIEALFARHGYSSSTISETGRSFVGTVQKSGDTFFFKYPKTASVSIRLKNEAVWYQGFQDLRSTLPVYIPALIDSGEDEGRFWLIREHLPESGRVADADRQWIDTNTFNQHLESTVDFLHILQHISIALPNDTEIPLTADRTFHDFNCGSNEEVVHFIRAIGARRAAYIHPNIIETLCSIVNSTELSAPALTYTDYKPWHFFVHDNKLALIDSENANNLGPKHFDLSFFYASIYGILNDPGLANKLLAIYMREITDKTTFLLQFRSLLARISIAALDDAIAAQKITTGHHQLIERVMTNTLL